MTAASCEGTYASGVEEVATELRQEFLDELADSVRALDVSLGEVAQGKLDQAAFIEKARRFALPLRGQAANFGVRLLGTIAARMEDYISVPPQPRFQGDVQQFIDTIVDVLEEAIPYDADESELVRRLPAKSAFDLGDIEVRNVEVLLVMLHGTQTRFVEREMQQCGYRTHVVTSVFDALPMAVKTKPDLIIVSALMPELDGIDLAVALTAMPTTRNIPLAMITSLDKNDPHLAFLPEHVPIIQKGASFGEDLANALESTFLI